MQCSFHQPQLYEEVRTIGLHPPSIRPLALLPCHFYLWHVESFINLWTRAWADCTKEPQVGPGAFCPTRRQSMDKTQQPPFLSLSGDLIRKPLAASSTAMNLCGFCCLLPTVALCTFATFLPHCIHTLAPPEGPLSHGSLLKSVPVLRLLHDGFLDSAKSHLLSSKLLISIHS